METAAYGLIEDNELSLITQYQDARLARLQGSNQLLPRQIEGMNSLQLANATRDDLKLFADLLPTTFEGGRDKQVCAAGIDRLPVRAMCLLPAGA